jgi:hypothetical protein
MIDRKSPVVLRYRLSTRRLLAVAQREPAGTRGGRNVAELVLTLVLVVLICWLIIASWIPGS